MSSHYLELAVLYRVRILVAAVCSGIVAMLLSLLVLKTSPSYTSTVILNMQPSEEALLFNREFMGRSQFNPATIITQTHIERLLSTPVAERAIETLMAGSEDEIEISTPPSALGQLKLWLWKTWTRLNFGEFRPAPPELQLINEFKEAVSVKTVEGSYILKIEATHEFPSIAADIANVLADTYIKMAGEGFAAESARGAAVLQERIDEGEAELNLLFEARSNLRSEYDIADIGRQASLQMNSIEASQQQLAEEQLERALKQAELEKLRRDVRGNSTQSRGPVQSLEEEIEILDQRIGFRRDRIAEISGELALLSFRETEFANLNTEIEALRARLDALRQQASSFELGVRSQAEQIQLVSPARPALYPSSPKVLINTVAAVIAAALIVYMLALMQDVFGTRIRTNGDLVTAMGDRALPSGSKRMLGGRGVLGFGRLRNRRRMRHFIEAFGQKMSVESGWNSSGILITGFVSQKELIEVRDFIGDVINKSVHRPGSKDEFRVTAIGAIQSVKDWDKHHDGPVIVVLKPNQKFGYELSELKQLGSNPLRHPLFMVWRG